MEDGYPQNLVFVSSGKDGRYNADDPADPDLEYNSDNLVMRITEYDWKNTGAATDLISRHELTIEKLQKIRDAVTGSKENASGNSFINDIGSVYPLTGSYIRYGSGMTNNIYRCIKKSYFNFPDNSF